MFSLGNNRTVAYGAPGHWSALRVSLGWDSGTIIRLKFTYHGLGELGRAPRNGASITACSKPREGPSSLFPPVKPTPRKGRFPQAARKSETTKGGGLAGGALISCMLPRALQKTTSRPLRPQ